MRVYWIIEGLLYHFYMEIIKMDSGVPTQSFSLFIKLISYQQYIDIKHQTRLRYK